jgi:hypothetical protein
MLMSMLVTWLVGIPAVTITSYYSLISHLKLCTNKDCLVMLVINDSMMLSG